MDKNITPSYPAYKVVMVGQSSSGKTCLINRLRFKQFSENMPATIGAAFAVHPVNDIMLQIWDTAGNERYRSITSMYLRGAHIVLYCIDCSLEFDVEYHRKEIENIRNSVDNTTVVIVMTKCDLNTNSTDKIIKSFANILDCEFYTCSSKTGENVDCIFESITHILKKMKPIKKSEVSLTTSVKSGCCYI